MKFTGIVEHFAHEKKELASGPLHIKTFVLAGNPRHSSYNNDIVTDKFIVTFSFKAADKVSLDFTKVGTLLTVCFDPTVREWNGKHFAENRGWFIGLADEEAALEYHRAETQAEAQKAGDSTTAAANAPRVQVAPAAPTAQPEVDDLPF